jgi:hypothetical protein
VLGDRSAGTPPRVAAVLRGHTGFAVLESDERLDVRRDSDAELSRDGGRTEVALLDRQVLFNEREDVARRARKYPTAARGSREAWLLEEEVCLLGDGVDWQQRRHDGCNKCEGAHARANWQFPSQLDRKISSEIGARSARGVLGRDRSQRKRSWLRLRCRSTCAC